MTDRIYKAVRPDGASFHDPNFRWLPEGWKSGNPIPTDWVVRHPNPGAKIEKSSGAHASRYLSVATVPTDCTGFQWPCVLLEVEAVGQACLDDQHPHKRRIYAARVIRELPAHEVFGPQGAEVVAILDRAAKLTAEEAKNLAAAWVAARDAAVAARDAAWDAARDAARAAARDAAWVAARPAARDAAVAAWDAAWDAAVATLARDLITTEHHDLMIGPWRAVMGDE